MALAAIMLSAATILLKGRRADAAFRTDLKYRRGRQSLAAEIDFESAFAIKRIVNIYESAGKAVNPEN